MSTDPAINWNFARAPGWIDPRATFARASVGRGINRMGRLEARPANTGRWRYNPATGLSEGLLIEAQRTNLLLYSEEFDNAAWTKTTCTVAANATTAPDGTATADSLTVTGADGNVAQAVTITTGRGAALSVFAKPFAASFFYAQLTDGSDVVEVWFNLASGAVGSNTGGGSSITFARAAIEQMSDGFFRCHVEVTTASVTTLTAKISAAAADSTAPANTDSVYAWGAMLSAAATRTGPTSYIPTTSGTVTREADRLIQAIDTSWFNVAEGSLYIDVTLGVPTATHAAAAIQFGGFGNTTSDRIYFERHATSGMALIAVASGSSKSLTQSVTYTPGARLKIAGAWKADDGAFTVNGAAVSTRSDLVIPAGLVRMNVGSAPWSAGPSGELANSIIREWQYYPRRLSNADLITLTA
jgi:hypothetical protein